MCFELPGSTNVAAGGRKAVPTPGQGISIPAAAPRGHLQEFAVPYGENYKPKQGFANAGQLGAIARRIST